ncbi:LysM peptidoglycan-binding domain-containing protein [Lactiplantibacillus sp. WILCCON 0030]|uniref:LysM peptidoglycan-binding domain-containing protein n=1 Tax=Lactiplantibacillus brownii TaxID=3069269 RepID=A0ABU1A9J9_9LACO|nr:LysM peptidoglycan-binding domain-containing protein [Lactiplantibacillus brownii]MDQ7937600.1 LysM peptidoglycan-binding domain-containing protein [Lactiplantibacillus brownii]
MSQAHTTGKVLAGTVGAVGLLLATGQAANAATVTVKQNDTVWGLAQQHGVSIKSVEKLNSASLNGNSSLIYVGQKLQISGESSSSSAKKGTYTVKAGDTLWDLADKYQTSVHELQTLNSLSGDLIVVGQNIQVPGATSTKAATSATTKTATPASAVSSSTTASTATSATSTASESTPVASTSTSAASESTEVQGSVSAASSSSSTATSASSVVSASSVTSESSSVAPAQTAVLRPVAASSTTSASSQATSSASTQVSSAASQSSTATTTTNQSSSTTSQSNSTASQSNTNTASQSSTSSASQSSSSAAQSSTTSAATSSASQASSTATTNNSSSTTTSNSDLSTGSVTSLALKLANANIPYVWGGSTLSGMDCSGLVSYVYLHAAGISLPHNTVAQEAYVSSHSVASAQPGDILFWGSRGATWHDAIYIGNNQYVAAPTEGQNVQVQTINSAFMPSFAGTVK